MPALAANVPGWRPAAGRPGNAQVKNDHVRVFRHSELQPAMAVPASRHLPDAAFSVRSIPASLPPSMRFLLDENGSYRVCPGPGPGPGTVSGDHDFVQLLFASGETRPSVVLVRDIDALPPTALAALLLAACPARSQNCSSPAPSPP